jgi:hypothetical protein
VPAAAHSAVDRPVRRRLLPMPADGWRLRPGLSGARADDGGPYLVGQLAACLPLPARAVEILDLTGRWCREGIPQRHRPWARWGCPCPCSGPSRPCCCR